MPGYPVTMAVAVENGPRIHDESMFGFLPTESADTLWGQRIHSNDENSDKTPSQPRKRNPS